MAQGRKRIIGNVPIAVNEQGRLEMKIKPALVKAFRLDVAGLLTVGGGGGNAVEDNPFRFIREIRIETSDGDQYKVFSATMQNFVQQYEKNTAPLVVGTLAGAIIAGAYPFQCSVEIDFDRIIAQFPEVTIFNSNNYDNVALIVQFGNATDFVTANGVLSGLTAQVVQIDRLPIDPADETEKRLRNIMTRKTQQFTAANTELAIDIPDKAEIQDMYIIARDFTAGHVAGERSDVLINNVRVVLDNGATTVLRLTWAQILQENKESYAIEANIAGFGALQFDPDGGFDDMLDLRGVNSPQIVFDVNAPIGGVGTAEIEVGFRQIVTPE